MASAELIAYKDISVRRHPGAWQIGYIERALVETAPPTYDDVIVITSINDGRHASRSLHYKDRAVDVRCFGHRPGGIKAVGANVIGGAAQLHRNQRIAAEAWRDRLASRLGDAFDVVLEADHIHIEHDPK